MSEWHPDQSRVPRILPDGLRKQRLVLSIRCTVRSSHCRSRATAFGDVTLTLPMSAYGRSRPFFTDRRLIRALVLPIHRGPLGEPTECAQVLVRSVRRSQNDLPATPRQFSFKPLSQAASDRRRSTGRVGIKRITPPLPSNRRPPVAQCDKRLGRHLVQRFHRVGNAELVTVSVVGKCVPCSGSQIDGQPTGGRYCWRTRITLTNRGSSCCCTR